MNIDADACVGITCACGGSRSGAQGMFMMKILSRNRKKNGNKGKQGDFAIALFIFIVLTIAIILTSCGSGGQPQSDPRLKWFHVLSSRIIIRDNQAEVDGTLQNTGSERYPFDVTIDATFYDKAGNVIGQAEGVAEDVSPGTTSTFVLMGKVDSLHYSHMQLTPVSLQERRKEKNLPNDPTG